MATPGARAREIDLNTISTADLEGIAKQQDQDLRNFTVSRDSLMDALSRYTESSAALAGLPPAGSGPQPLLVPLTSSLFVPGTLVGGEEVIVDVGTGFYVSKTPADAAVLLERRAVDVRRSLEDVSRVIKERTKNMQVISEVLGERADEAARAAAAAGMSST